MSKDSPGLIEARCDHRRVVGRVQGSSPGPSLIVMSGIHGNEPAGVKAGKRVVRRLQSLQGALRGEAIFVAGNLRALKDGCRFVHHDLNRIWTLDEVQLLETVPPNDGESVEHTQQREVLQLIRESIDTARGPIFFMDLHTSSADGPPFVTVGDTLRNRRFARRMPLPLILGLEEQVDGALLEYLNNFGIITMGVEAGRHDAPESVDYHEAVIWLALAAAGLISEDAVPDLARLRKLLTDAARGAPRVVEVRRRHAITAKDAFAMNPGFANFQAVSEGDEVARDIRGPVEAPETGLILLPLYQGQGDDGFFIAREVKMFWLKVSALLRKLRLSATMAILPGVRRHSEDDDVLIVDTSVARLYPLEIFHLFGFRKLRRNGTKLVVSRRRHDLEPPGQIDLSSGS